MYTGLKQIAKKPSDLLAGMAFKEFEKVPPKKGMAYSYWHFIFIALTLIAFAVRLKLVSALYWKMG